MEDIRHFVPSFPATYIDVYLRLGPSRHLLQGYSLSGSEAAGYRCLAAKRQGKHVIYNSGSGDKQVFGLQSLFVEPGFSRRPSLHKCNLFFLAFIIYYERNRLFYRVITLGDLLYRAIDTYRRHNFVFHEPCFRNAADNIALFDLIAGFD